MALTESVEDYLEAILILKLNNQVCKAINIADRLGVSKPAVTKAINYLIQLGYVKKEGTKIDLTAVGFQIANKTYNKHLKIKEFLMLIGVEEEIADIDCCKIEHCVSDTTFEAIKNHLDSIKNK